MSGTSQLRERPAASRASPGPAASRSRRGRSSNGVRPTPVLLLLPTVIVLGGVLVYPLVQLVMNSFRDFGLRAIFLGTTAWVGVDNYRAMLTDPEFVPVLVRTALFTLITVTLIITMGLIISQLMMRLGRVMKTTLSIVLIIAWAVPTVSSTLLWKWLYQPGYGVMNWLLTQLRIFGDLTMYSWTAEPVAAFALVILLITWHSVPFVALTLHAGQQQIPRDFYEAAAMDGAGPWRTYYMITIPFLRPILYLVTILSIIWHFNQFNQIWILTQGGPANGTTTLGIWAFRTAFAANSFGEGSAIAVVTGILLLLLITFYIRRLVRSGERI